MFFYRLYGIHDATHFDENVVWDDVGRVSVIALAYMPSMLLETLML